MSINSDNSFTVKSKVNFDNAKEVLRYLCVNNNGFINNKLNSSICCLNWLLKCPTATKDLKLAAPKHNKQFNDLIERYIHISPFDPCSYIHEIRDVLFQDTNTVEFDVTAEAVYIFAKYISKDIDLYIAYCENDIYTIIPGMTRDEQKVEMNRWLQGGYNDKIVYNKLFPITAKYLRDNAQWENGIYKKSSGLFRDIETHKLIEICKSCESKVMNHLHDSVYTTKNGLKDVIDAYKALYGSGLKYKIREYKTLNVDCIDHVKSHAWKDEDVLSAAQIEQRELYKSCCITEEHPMEFKVCRWDHPDVDKQVLQSIKAERIAEKFV